MENMKELNMDVLEQVTGGAVLVSGGYLDKELVEKRKQEKQRKELHDRTIALQEQAALNQANAAARIKEEIHRHREELGL